MKLGGTYYVYRGVDPWPQVAAELGIDPARAHERATDLAQRAPDAFSEASRDERVRALGRELPRGSSISWRSAQRGAWRSSTIPRPDATSGLLVNPGEACGQSG